MRKLFTRSSTHPDCLPGHDHLEPAARDFDKMLSAVEAKNPPSPARELVEAAFRGDLEAVRCLLDSGARVDEPDGLGKTALHAAIEGANVDVIAFLIDRGANVNGAPGDEWTPLFHAIDVEGDAASQLGVLPSVATIPRLLLKRGADPRRPGLNGQRPRDLAISYDHQDAVQAIDEAILRIGGTRPG